MSWIDHLDRNLVGAPPPPEQLDYAALGPGLVRLDANEAAYPPDDADREAMQAALAALDPRRYPDASARALRETLAERWDAAPEQLLVGNGSEELIDLLIRTLASGSRPSPGKVLVAVPTFGEYARLARLHGAKTVDVPLGPRFELEEERLREAIERERPSVAFFASPNNPTGNLLDAGVLERLARAMDGVLVVDEAYGDFAGRSLVGRVGVVEGLVVLRSLSKIGLAGLRLGALVGPTDLVAALDRCRPPFGVSAVSMALARAVLDDPARLDGRVARIVAHRGELVRLLAGIPGVAVFPSDASFVLVRTPVPAGVVWRALLSRGVLVSDVSRHPGLAGCLRVTVGTREDNRRCVRALGEALEELGGADARRACRGADPGTCVAA